MAVNQHIWPWDSQPQEAVVARGPLRDWNFTPSNAGRDSVVGSAVMDSINTAYENGRGGQGFKLAGTVPTTFLEWDDNYRGQIKNQLTWYFFGRIDASSTGLLLGNAQKTGAGYNSMLYIGNGNAPNFFVKTSGSGSSANGSAITALLGTDITMVGTYDGETLRIYVNGILSGSTAKTGNVDTTSFSTLLNRWNSTSSKTGLAYRGGVEARAWTPAEVADFHAKPWASGYGRLSIPIPVSAGGGPTPVGLATETDTSLALSSLQIVATGRADETDTSLALTPVQVHAVGLATEADSALALSPVQILPVGLSTEADSALALLPGASNAVGIAEETDAAIALAAVQIAQVGVAIEADTALALPGVSIAATGAASESDAAFALVAVQRMLSGIALEIDAALALTVGDAEEPTFTVPSRSRIGGSPASNQAVRLGAAAARTPGARIGQAAARAETTRIGDPTP